MHYPDQTFTELFDEIAATRAHYEAMRSSEGPLEERARLVTRLHTLRAELAELRATSI